MKSSAALLLLLSLGACSKAGSSPTPAPETPARDPVAVMNADIDALMAKPEHTEPRVTIQHLLVGVTGPRIRIQRSPGEAETMAADLYARIRAGEEFDTLVKNYTNDSHPGIYTMVLKGASDGTVWARGDMAQAFGDVAWHLAVGEYGVTRYDGGVPGSKPKSEFGYHIIRRLE